MRRALAVRVGDVRPRGQSGLDDRIIDVDRMLGTGGAFLVTQGSTWDLVGTGGNATPASQSVAGDVRNMRTTWAITASPAICSFTIKDVGGSLNGKARAVFDEAAQRLFVSETGFTGNLGTASVTGCYGQLEPGNPMNVEATFDVTWPDGAINLS